MEQIFKSDSYNLNTPVLLICFNRPEHTRQVLQRILELQPQDLYVFQDGARDGNDNDDCKCQQVRDVISQLIGCDALQVGQTTLRTTRSTLHFYGSSVNLGCGAGPMTGISWFFDNVEQGIVMEDDCLAHPDFFPYCEELLNKYKGSDVKFINATLYDERWTQALEGHEESYAFSRYMVTGAWASWRSTWQGFDLDLLDMDARAFRHQVNALTCNKAEADWWYYKVKQIQMDRSKKSYWDYQMQIFLFCQNAVTIHPHRNLISNIGFGEGGTHTMNNNCGMGDRPVYPILPLVHPDFITVDAARDCSCWAKAHSRGYWKDLVNNLYRSMLLSNGLGHWFLKAYKKLRGKQLTMPAV